MRRYPFQCVAGCVAICCNMLQYIAGGCSVTKRATVRCNVLECVAECVAICCSVLQYIAVCCGVLQCGSVCCSILQCVAPDPAGETT